MSTSSFAISDDGLVVKIQELDIKKFRKFIKEHEGKDLQPENPDDEESMYDALRDFLLEDTQWFIGKEWADGVICHKWSYGNDICGDFIQLKSAVHDVGVDLENDEWVLMCLPRYASLFEQAYSSEEALIAEMKSLYSKFLPDNFNYRDRLIKLCGVAWG